MEKDNNHVLQTKQRGAIKIVLSLLYPFGAFIYSLFDVKSKSSYWVFAFFCVLFGLTFIATSDQLDSTRYVEQFQAFCLDPEGNIAYIFDEYLNNDTQIKDIYIYIMYYISARIDGDNYHVLFALFSIVFSYFYLKSMRLLTSNKNFEYSALCFILLFIFTFSNPILNINGVRFWTAAWIAVYIMLCVIVERKYIYIVFIATLPFIHVSYYVFIVFFLISYLLKNHVNLLFSLYILSFFFSDVVLNFLPERSPELPAVFDHLLYSYVYSDKAIAKMEETGIYDIPTYARFLNNLPRYFGIVSVFFLYTIRYSLKKSPFAYPLFGFYLGYNTLVNFTSVIPSMVRFYALGTPILVYLWIESLIKYKQFRWLLLISPLLYAYPLLYWYRRMTWVTDPYLLVTNTIHLLIRNLQ